MTDGDGAPKKRGRPRQYPGTEKRPTLTFRVRGRMYERLTEAAVGSERSLSEEIERRIEMSFETADTAAAASTAAAAAVQEHFAQVALGTRHTTIRYTRRDFGGGEAFAFGYWMAKEFAKHRAKARADLPPGQLWYKDPDRLAVVRQKMHEYLDNLLGKNVGLLRFDPGYDMFERFTDYHTKDAANGVFDREAAEADAAYERGEHYLSDPDF